MLDRYVCVDLETTSLEPAKNEIIEIGAVKIENGQIIDRYEQLIKPNETVPPFIWTLTGIKQADIDPRARPETLTPEQFGKLSNLC